MDPSEISGEQVPADAAGGVDSFDVMPKMHAWNQ
jgi:hypothetical protein